MKLQELLKGMDIPEHRKELNKSNLSWLIRNLRTKNYDHPNFMNAEQAIINALKEKKYVR